MSMTAIEKRERTARLQSAHKLYQDYNQGRDDASEYLTAAGHPLAKWYLAIANLFFKTRYCSNASERVLASNGSGSETVTLHKPTIRERRDHGWVFNGEFYPGAYPAHPQWMQWVHAFAESGFEGTHAHMDCILTTITVKTNRAEVRDALYDFAGQNPWLKCERRYDHALSLTFIRVNNKIPSARGFAKTMRLLKTLFKGCWLKALNEAEITSPIEELPLAERSVMLGGGSLVVRNARTILLPLWRLGKSTEVQAHNISVIQQIENLLADGYPLNASIEQHLSHVFRAPALQALKDKYSKSDTAKRAD